MTSAQDRHDDRRAERVADRIETLTDEQRQRILWRVTSRNPDMVDAIINEFEATHWEWGR
jgi:hypothetical protein